MNPNRCINGSKIIDYFRIVMVDIYKRPMYTLLISANYRYGEEWYPYLNYDLTLIDFLIACTEMRHFVCSTIDTLLNNLAKQRNTIEAPHYMCCVCV